MTITVIIPVHNGAADLPHCLAAVRAATPAPDEIIVVDDGSRDQSAEIARRSGAKVLQLPVAVGPAQARNLGAAAARTELLFFVDADVCVHRDVIERIQETFAATPDLVAVFGSYDDRPAHPGFLSQYRNLLHHYYHQTANEEAVTFWAGCGAIRRLTFAEMGGFAVAWRHKIEDIELGCRLRRAGQRVRLCKQLLGQHRKRWTVGSMLHTDVFVRGVPWTELIWREGELVSDLNLRAANRLSVALVWVGPLFLVLGLAYPLAWGAAAVAGVALLFLNAHLYRFFLAQRGPRFALLAVPWHWFYYWYGGLAFLIGTARHLVRQASHPLRGPARDATQR